MSKKLKLGVFGLGSVGQGFYELLEQSNHPNLEIKKIVIKNPNKIRTIASTVISTTPGDILDDPEIDIVVELIDDASTALDILKQSLRKGKAVVTANKKMLAENLEEIYWLQEKYNTPVIYEGAVCGSIPFIRNLETHYAFDEIQSMEGIFNGSTNYILTKMIEEKKHYAEALEDAQQLGFAESNPTLDVKGYDSKYKLAITIAHSFGCFVKPDQILNLGIDRITEHDIRFARQQGCTIKLVAKAQKMGNKIVGLVAPMFVPLESPLAQVKNEFNAINIVGSATGAQLLTGKGAGSLPTGLVVLADVAGVAAQYKYSYPKIQANEEISFESNVLVYAHISFGGTNGVHISDFVEFTGGYQGENRHFMNGWIRTQKLLEWVDREDLSIILKNDVQWRACVQEKEQEFSLV